MIGVKSRDARTGGAVKNEIAYTYGGEGRGRVTTSAQAHDGSVGSGTPTVQYAYESGADGTGASGDNAAEFVRLQKVTHQGGDRLLAAGGLAEFTIQVVEDGDGPGRDRARRGRRAQALRLRAPPAEGPDGGLVARR